MSFFGPKQEVVHEDVTFGVTGDIRGATWMSQEEDELMADVLTRVKAAITGQLSVLTAGSHDWQPHPGGGTTEYGPFKMEHSSSDGLKLRIHVSITSQKLITNVAWLNANLRKIISDASVGYFIDSVTKKLLEAIAKRDDSKS